MMSNETATQIGYMHLTPQERFGDMVLTQRANRKLPCRTVAKALKISEQQVRYVEKGNNACSWQVYVAFCRYYDMDLDATARTCGL